MLAQIKRILNHHNPTKFVGNVAAEKHWQDRAYGNNISVANNIQKVESTLNKQDRNKHVAVLSHWLELFLPDLNLTPQSLIYKEEKVIASSSMDTFRDSIFHLYQ